MTFPLGRVQCYFWYTETVSAFRTRNGVLSNPFFAGRATIKSFLLVVLRPEERNQEENRRQYEQN